MCDARPTNQDPSEDEFLVCTPAAGVNPGANLSTSPPLVLWNPGNSLYYVDIKTAFASYISGNMDSGSIVVGVSKQSGSPGGTPVFPVNRFVAGSVPPSSLQAFLAPTLENTPTIVRPVAQLGTTSAVAALPLHTPSEAECRLTLAPGYAACLQGVGGTGAGAPLVLLGLAFAIRKIKL